MNTTRSIIPRGTIYVGGSVHGFPPGCPLELPEAIAAALEQAGHVETTPQQSEPAQE